MRLHYTGLRNIGVGSGVEDGFVLRKGFLFERCITFGAGCPLFLPGWKVVERLAVKRLLELSADSHRILFASSNAREMFHWF